MTTIMHKDSSCNILTSEISLFLQLLWALLPFTGQSVADENIVYYFSQTVNVACYVGRLSTGDIFSLHEMSDMTNVPCSLQVLINVEYVAETVHLALAVMASRSLARFVSF